MGYNNKIIEPILWKDGELEIIDQTRLPWERVYLKLTTLDEVIKAIKDLRVRGAPAIGIVGTYGLLTIIRASKAISFDEFLREVDFGIQSLLEARPTGVNLKWGLDRMRRCAIRNKTLPLLELKDALEKEAISIHEDERKRCDRIASHGVSLIKDGSTVLTHCNAGILATGGIGTALGVIYKAIELGKRVSLIVTETRPLLQGARLTCWELMEMGVDVTLICDTAVGRVMQEGRVDLCVVGADRIASNGDVANKIGTYQIALAAKETGIPLYVAAPTSTFDPDLRDGEGIPIEVRGEDEIRSCFGIPPYIKIYNPAFDITPSSLISAFITEKGLVYPPYTEWIRRLKNDEESI